MATLSITQTTNSMLFASRGLEPRQGWQVGFEILHLDAVWWYFLWTPAWFFCCCVPLGGFLVVFCFNEISNLIKTKYQSVACFFGKKKTQTLNSHHWRIRPSGLCSNILRIGDHPPQWWEASVLPSANGCSLGVRAQVKIPKPSLLSLKYCPWQWKKSGKVKKGSKKVLDPFFVWQRNTTKHMHSWFFSIFCISIFEAVWFFPCLIAAAIHLKSEDASTNPAHLLADSKRPSIPFFSVTSTTQVTGPSCFAHGQRHPRPINSCIWTKLDLQLLQVPCCPPVKIHLYSLMLKPSRLMTHRSCSGGLGWSPISNTSSC